MNVLHWEKVFEKTVRQPRPVLDALVQTTMDAKAADNSWYSHGHFHAFAICIQTNARQHGTYVSLRYIMQIYMHRNMVIYMHCSVNAL